MTVCVVGAGAWGTALALHCARLGHDVVLVARNPDPIRAARESPRLPGAVLPNQVEVADKPPNRADLVLLAVPVQHLREVLGSGLPDAPLVLCMKGLERGSNLFPAEIASETCPGTSVAILTGPNFAGELARGLPAAAVLASLTPALRETVVPLLGSRNYRLYGSNDPVGAQVGGAAKNVVAIAAGIAVGAGLGENARAALLTRGIAEIGRLAEALGGSARTVAGLSGLGDLVLTCTGLASRNFRFGLAVGQGTHPAAARTAIGAAVEGVDAAPALLGRAGSVSCPIIAGVSSVLAGNADVAGVIAGLLERPFVDE